MRKHRILFVGVGKLGGHLLDVLLRVPGNHRFLIAGRNLETLRPRVNLSLLAALQLGYTPQVECMQLDLRNMEHTATILAHFQPDIIVCAATLQSLASTSRLASPFAQKLAVAPMGPRLPLHLTLIYKLMQAVHMAGAEHTTKILNAIYPDVIHPLLEKVRLAPTTGIGDLANNVPALRLSMARKFDVPAAQVEIRLVMARWVSYWMSRTNVATMPFHLTVLINGEDRTHVLERASVFDDLSTRLKRIGGDLGLLMTATSATVVFQAMVQDREIITHVPGPQGLPGGYPVRVNANGVEITLPSGVTLETAQHINEAGLRLDGIERIGHDGTVFFTDEAVSVFKEILGYECHSLPLAETEERAEELQARYERASSS